jgi:transposase InsO family protein
MKTLMKLQDLTTVDQLREFLSGTRAVAFSVISDKDDCYRWLQAELIRFRYLKSSREDKGVIMRYLIKVSGYSRQQLTRLVAQFRQNGRLQRRQRTVAGFKTRYTAEDVRLLAAMDRLHDTPCGPKVKKLCERACTLFGQIEYAALASISVSHLYNLRNSKPYHQLRRHFEKTRPQASRIGERRKPRPNGKPGYIRIDTVHQGDLDKLKGVYHINAVDEVTQFEMVCSVEKISERYLVPALIQLLEDYPFKIRGFHSDNGSEYVNFTVARLLDKLRVEFTKSRARQSNDNALAESKNASVIRKQFGYEHIPQRWAPLLNDFHRQHLNPYLNYHRPCFFPETRTDSKGKERKIYRFENLMTPYEKLKSLPRAKQYLKPGVSFATLNRIAAETSDNQAADQLQKARQKLFKTIHGRDLAIG